MALRRTIIAGDAAGQGDQRFLPIRHNNTQVKVPTLLLAALTCWKTVLLHFLGRPDYAGVED
jgi:hypothetical protein